MDHKEARELLEKHKAALAEHFDHVQILVSWDEGENTMGEYAGAGNYYARRDLCRQFVEDEQDKNTACRIAEELKD